MASISSLSPHLCSVWWCNSTQLHLKSHFARPSNQLKSNRHTLWRGLTTTCSFHIHFSQFTRFLSLTHTLALHLSVCVSVSVSQVKLPSVIFPYLNHLFNRTNKWHCVSRHNTQYPCAFIFAIRLFTRVRVFAIFLTRKNPFRPPSILLPPPCSCAAAETVCVCIAKERKEKRKKTCILLTCFNLPFNSCPLQLLYSLYIDSNAACNNWLLCVRIFFSQSDSHLGQ